MDPNPGAVTGQPAKPLPASDFLLRARERLEDSGFRCATNVDPYALVAHRSHIELTKFGNVDTSFLFARFPTIDRDQLDAFSAASFQAALAARGPRPPRGFFEAVFACGVAVVESAPPDALDWVRRQTGPKHWAATENRVIFDVATQQLALYEGVPFWGGAYVSGQRNLIRALLG